MVGGRRANGVGRKVGPCWMVTNWIYKDRRASEGPGGGRWCSERHYGQNRSTTELWKPQVFRTGDAASTAN